ncbi:MAG: Nif3-like dinuclear metal center hexameric protein [Aquiluna sp.]|nr:Nif3-like dinuclear metal center hexameric protein [Aquiluna sp.]
MEILSTLIKHFEEIWPDTGTESWDFPGLMLGNPNQEISSCMLTVDVTLATIEEASNNGAQLIIAHHPLFLHGAHELSEINPKGAIAALAARKGVAVYAAHTNADFVAGGVSETLATRIGVDIQGKSDDFSKQGVIGTLKEPTSLIGFSRSVAKVLPPVAQGVKVSGDPDKVISRIGLVAGAGDSFLERALDQNLDLFITSDLRHHKSLDFIESSNLNDGPALMDISHWAAEWLWLERVQSDLAGAFPSVKFEVSDISTDPWDFVVMQ